MTVTTMSRERHPAHRATAAEQSAMELQRAAIRRDLDGGWLDQLHATPMPVRVQLIRQDLPAELRVEREVELTVAHHSCHTLADCWPVHAPGAVARRTAAEWAAAHGMLLAYVVLHPMNATLWLAYLARPKPDPTEGTNHATQ